MKYKELVNKLSKYRVDLKMSARELSQMIGKHDGYINKLESTDFIIPSNVLLEIIGAFGVSEEEFFSFDSFSAEDKKLINDFHKLSDANKTTVIDLIKNLKHAQNEFETAINNYEFAIDPELVDYYTYNIKATQTRYQYLLKKAKERGL